MEEWISLAIQIPIVAAFMLFVLEITKRNNEHQEKRDAYWHDFFTRQQEVWQRFITDQRLATVTALADVSDKLRDTTVQLEKLTEIMMRHDESCEQFMSIAQFVAPGTQPLQIDERRDRSPDIT